jgi:hypothetical protein
MWILIRDKLDTGQQTAFSLGFTAGAFENP